MLRLALPGILLVAVLAAAPAATAGPDLPGPHDAAPFWCDGDSWTSYWECCLYGMGAGFHVDASNRRDPVGEHSHCWAS